MSSSNMFNTAALDASLILQAKDKVREMIAAMSNTWLDKVDPIYKKRFSAALARFLKAANNVAENGDPEEIIQLVEQLRAYQPMITTDEYATFLMERARFSNRLQEIVDAKIPADTPLTLVWREAAVKANKFKEYVATAGMFLDKVKLEKLKVEWNKFAEQVKQKEDKVLEVSHKDIQSKAVIVAVEEVPEGTHISSSIWDMITAPVMPPQHYLDYISGKISLEEYKLIESQKAAAEAEEEAKHFKAGDTLEVIEAVDEDNEPIEGGLALGECVTMIDRTSEYREFIIVERVDGRQVQLEKKRFKLKERKDGTQ